MGWRALAVAMLCACGRLSFEPLAGDGSGDGAVVLPPGCIAKLYARHDHVCAIKLDGTSWCWGHGTNGQLGTNTSENTFVPAQVIGVTASDLVLGGRHTCAIAPGGAVSCFGDNQFGELAIGAVSVEERVAQPALGGRVVQQLVAGGKHLCALFPDLTYECYGCSTYDESSAGRCTGSTGTTPYGGTLPAGATLGGGNRHTCAVAPGGSLSCWGLDDHRQLGDGTTQYSNAAVAVPGVTNVTAVTGGQAHTCALRSGGDVWCWGKDDYGQAGEGLTTDRIQPGAVPGLVGIVQVAAGGYHTCARDSAGAVWCWGANQSGQLGRGTMDDDLHPMPERAIGIPPVVDLVAGTAFTCARDADNHGWCWGANGRGQLAIDVEGHPESVTPIVLALACP